MLHYLDKLSEAQVQHIMICGSTHYDLCMTEVHHVTKAYLLSHVVYVPVDLRADANEWMQM